MISTGIYLALTLSCLTGVAAFALLVAENAAEKRRREQLRHIRHWRNGRLEE